MTMTTINHHGLSNTYTETNLLILNKRIEGWISKNSFCQRVATVLCAEPRDFLLPAGTVFSGHSAFSIPQELYQSKSEQDFANRRSLLLMLDRCILPWCWTGDSYLDDGQVYLTLMLDRCSGAVMTFPLRSSWFMRRKAMMLILVTSSPVTCVKHTNTLKPQLHAHSIWCSTSKFLSKPGRKIETPVFIAVVFDFAKFTFKVQAIRKCQWSLPVAVQ